MFEHMIDVEQLADLDPAGVLAETERAQVEMVAAEVRRFWLAAHWVDVNSGDALTELRRARGVRVLPGMERAKRSGADGTPLVAEFAVAELGAVAGMSPQSVRCFVEDAVNVRHRHPVLWSALQTGRGRVWQAREIARLCATAGLDQAQAAWVDAVTTPYLVSLPWTRFRALVDAKIIEADPAAAQERARAAALARFVRTGQSNEFGIKSIYARATAGDAICFTAMVDRIAHVLAEHGDTEPVDVLRSKALGILATPARALQMLLNAAPDGTAPNGTAPNGTAAGGDDADKDAAPDDADGDAPGDAPENDAPGDAHGAGDADVDLEPGNDEDLLGNAADGAHGPAGPAGPAGPDNPGDSGPFTGPGARAIAAARARVDPKRLLSQATLYVHLSQESLHHRGGVARVEGTGPITIEQVVDFLGHANVRVTPVADVAGQVPVDGYEVPARMREALHLRHPACVWPWATHLSRRKDADHVAPYLSPDQGGPSGQTSMDNLAWLSRLPHRLKTHGRWRLRQPTPGVMQWRSPHGYWFRVDHQGTHPLGRETDPGQPPAPTRKASVTWPGTPASPLEHHLADLLQRHRH
jgi:hypothetical protein